MSHSKVRPPDRSWPQHLFEPTGVAVLGASTRKHRVAGRPVDYLVRHGFDGAIYPVNPHRDRVQGLRSYASLADVPDPLEVAIVAVPQTLVADGLRACAERRVSTVIVFASGYAEMGREGQRRERELLDIARQGDMRLLGPNCLGTIGGEHRATLTFASALDVGAVRPGPLAILTQSGAFASFAFVLAQRAGLGVAYLANTGNEADLTIGDVMDEVVGHPEVGVVLLHVEGLRDRVRFEVALEHARTLNKPVALLKVGRTEAGRRAVRRHTGAHPDQGLGAEQLAADYGVIPVTSVSDLVDVARVFAPQRPPRGPRAGIVSLSGGAAALLADACTEHGLSVEPLPASLQRDLEQHLPWYASVANPVDLTGAILDNPAALADILVRCARSDAIDVLLLVLGNVVVGEDELTDAVLESWQQSAKPLIVAWTGGSGRAAARLAACGVPVYEEPLRLAWAARLLHARTAQGDPVTKGG